MGVNGDQAFIPSSLGISSDKFSNGFVLVQPGASWSSPNSGYVTVTASEAVTSGELQFILYVVQQAGVDWPSS
jgi:hypothetical protein